MGGGAGAGVQGAHGALPEGVKCELGTLLRFSSQAGMCAPRGQLLSSDSPTHPAPRPLPPPPGVGVGEGGRGCPPLAGSAGYLTRYPVGAELPEAQRGLDPPQKGHHVQVLDPAPAGVTRPVPQAPPPPSLPGEGPRGGSQETGTPPDFQPCVGSWEAGFPF